LERNRLHDDDRIPHQHQVSDGRLSGPAATEAGSFKTESDFMMDLRTDEDEIFHYAKRYAHLIPPVSRQLMNRMSYNPVPMPETPEDRQKPK